MIRLIMVACHIAVWGSIGLVLFPFYLVVGEAASYHFFRAFSRLLFSLSGVSFTVKGIEQVVPSRRYVVVANHQSFFDIPACMAALPMDTRFFAKRELVWLPFIGIIMVLYGNVIVNRADARGAVEALARAKKLLARRTLVIFPEGTRSTDGKVHTFKTAGLSLATDTGAPILPIAIQGTGKVLPKGKVIPRPGPVEVTILPPVEVAPATDRKELAARLEQAIRQVIETENHA